MERVSRLRQWLGSEDLAQAVASYCEQGLQVVPCHHPTITVGPGSCCAWVCSCGSPACPTPGEHPVPGHWAGEPMDEPAGIAALWRQDPERNVGLLTGGTFEVLDVPAAFGKAALERCARRGLSGPVVRTGSGRLHLYVTATGMPNGFVPNQPGSGRNGVFWHGEGGWVLAPPSRHMNGGISRWLEPLSSPLPAAHLVLRELLDLQAELCDRAGVPGVADVLGTAGFPGAAAPGRTGR